MTDHDDAPAQVTAHAEATTYLHGRNGWPTRDLVAIRRETTPDRLAVVDASTGDRYTYRELDALVGRVAVALEALVDGDDTERVAVLAPASHRFVGLLHAAWRSGIQLVPLDTRGAPETAAQQLAHVDASTLIAHADCDELAARVASADAAPAKLSVHDLEEFAFSVEDGGDAQSGVEDQLSSAGSDSRAFAPDEAPVVLFTSGTTGAPKAVPLTVSNLLASATASAFRLGVSPADRWLSPLPVSHMGGLAPAIRCAFYGSTVVLQRGFDADATADALATHDATGVSLVPTALDRLLDAGWEPDPALRFVLLGGAAASPELVARCETAGVPVHPTYGMTETASQIATATPEQAFAHPETVGQPLVTTTVRVVDADGSLLNPGETGEIVVDGPTVTPGYLDGTEVDDDGDGTTGPFSKLGFHTGDVGYRDEDGRLYVTGRLDETIVTGGENVQPARVERALESLDAVAAAAVVGVPDDEWGERVTALVVPTGERSHGELDPNELRAATHESLAAHERPKTVVVADSLPRTSSGTVDHDAVRERVTDSD